MLLAMTVWGCDRNKRREQEREMEKRMGKTKNHKREQTSIKA